MILRLLKMLTCKHDWKKLRFVDSWHDGDPSHMVWEYWYCECSICGKHKTVVFTYPVDTEVSD